MKCLVLTGCLLVQMGITALPVNAEDWQILSWDKQTLDIPTLTSDKAWPMGVGHPLLGPFSEKEIVLPIHKALPKGTQCLQLWVSDDVGVWGKGTQSRITFMLRDGDRTIELIENTIQDMAPPKVQFTQHSYYAQVNRWTLRKAFLAQPANGLVLESVRIDRKFPQRDNMLVGPVFVQSQTANPFTAKHVWKVKDFVTPKPISNYWTAAHFYAYGYERTPQILPAGWRTLIDSDNLASLRVILTTNAHQPIWRVDVKSEALAKPIDLPRLPVGCYLLELAGHDTFGQLIDRKRMVYEVLRDDDVPAILPPLPTARQPLYVNGLQFGKASGIAKKPLKLSIDSNLKLDWQITGMGVSDGQVFAQGQLTADSDHAIQWTPPTSGGFELTVTAYNSAGKIVERESSRLGINGADALPKSTTRLPIQKVQAFNEQPLLADLIYIHDDPEQIERLPENSLDALLDGTRRANQQVILSVPWYRLEPVAQCYNWQALDNYIDKAYKKSGKPIGLGLRFTGDNLPMWLWFEELTWQNQQTIHAGYHYVSPMGPNFRAAQERMQAAVFKQYQDDPRVGFYLYYAGPSEGFMTDTEPKIADYSPNAQQMFREYLSKQYSNIADLNKAWGSTFSNWQSVIPPLPNWSLEQENSAAWWDFHQFKQQFVADRLMRIQSLARTIEPTKPMIMYAKEGFGSTGLLAPVFRQNQFRYTNGGGETLISYMQLCVMRNHGVQVSCEGRRVMPNFGSVCSVITNSLLAGDYQGHHQNWGMVWAKRPHIGLDEYETARILSKNIGKHAQELNQTQPAARWAGYHGSVAKMMESRAFRGRVTDDFYDLNKVARYQLHKPCNWVDDTSELSAMRRYPLLVDVGANILTNTAADNLIQYMQQGGTFIASANTGLYEPGKSMPSYKLLRALGVIALKPPQSKRVQQIKTPDGQTLLIDSICMVRWDKQANAKVLASNAKGKPRLWSLKVGKGRLILSAGDIDFNRSTKMLDQWINQWADGSMPFNITTDRHCTAGILQNDQADFVVLNAPLPDENENATLASILDAKPVQVTLSNLPVQVKQITDITTGKIYLTQERACSLTIQPGRLHVMRIDKHTDKPQKR